MYWRIKKGIHPGLVTSVDRKELGLLQGMDCFQRHLHKSTVTNRSDALHVQFQSYCPPWMQPSLESKGMLEERLALFLRGFVEEFPVPNDENYVYPECDERVRVEITPLHSTIPYGGALANALLPDVKVVFTLRNPVERFISHFSMFFPIYVQKCNYTSAGFAYMNQIRNKFKKDPVGYESAVEVYKKAWIAQLESAVDTEISLMREKCLGGGCDWWKWMNEEAMKREGWIDSEKCEKFQAVLSPPVPMLSYGLYAALLSSWLRSFPPRQIFLIASEEFKLHPDEIMMELSSVLGLDPRLIRDFSGAKISLTPVKATDETVRDDSGKVTTRVGLYQNQGKGQHYDQDWVPKTVLEKLEEFYRPHNLILFELLRNNGYVDFAGRLEKLWT
jgi:hypothetical protein